MAGRMTDARRQRMSEIGKARFAALPLDGTCRKCGAAIVGRYTFCKACWAGLDDASRSAINALYVPGSSPSQQKDPAYWSAIDAAVDDGPF